MEFKFRLGCFHFILNMGKIKKSLSRFIDLAPVDNAEDKDGYYKNALDYAMHNERIKNIALTGPYGSGKSSLIKTYEKASSYTFLNISLASFKENTTTQESNQDEIDNNKNILIERSILQQMLYGANANKLPYSRFKRIATPEWPKTKTILFASWAVIGSFLWQEKDKITNQPINNLHYVFSISLIVFFFSILILLALDIYRASFKVSLKKVSLTNAEIETGDIAEGSILNKYLDEILYFFQATKYDVVVFEDLDRFGSPEIFVKLREINKLINDNKNTSGNIKFLYALKDDMFANNNRAKFFDFIIPIVPVINSYNSIDKIRERIANETFKDKINPQFIREVALYLDDLRLIHNIFNEFVIYSEKLNSDSLNNTKLLAILIYKNVYPDDFEKLHHGAGALYSASIKRHKIIQSEKERLLSEITENKEKIHFSDNEETNSILNLIRSFIGYLTLLFPGNPITGIQFNQRNINLKEVLDYDNFEEIIKSKNIIVTIPGGYYSSQHTVEIENIRSEISPHASFQQRKEYIENKAKENRILLNNTIRDLEQKITELT